jgi:hypothetical protein
LQQVTICHGGYLFIPAILLVWTVKELQSRCHVFDYIMDGAVWKTCLGSMLRRLCDASQPVFRNVKG